MQEIAHGIYLETGLSGVSLGVISQPHGLLLIDAPPKPDDIKTWRTALLNLSGGVDRVLVNLDAHIDRTLGGRAMECTIIAHEKTSQVFRNRPNTFKAQSVETGSEWEHLNGMSGTRWAPPEVTFDQQMWIHWGEAPVSLEFHPGPNPGAIWAVIPAERVAFVGDLITPGQPPFLDAADLPEWIASLNILLGTDWRSYTLVSGRGGLMAQKEVRNQIDYLTKIHTALEELAKKKEPPEATEALIPGLMTSFRGAGEKKSMYTQRLKYGLNHYYTRHYRPSTDAGDE